MRLHFQNSIKPFSIIESFKRFTKIQAFSGILLLIVTVVALIWANSPWSYHYFNLWETPFTIGIGEYQLSKPLLLWINDGLMALFFFVIGLELKREIIFGELSSFKKAALPIFAAIGGMVVPALIYILFNYDTPSSKGWGVPMATDIAFSLGILALLGKRIPLALKIFLTALAITDDLGAVIVIALFYSSDISVINLSIGAIFLAIMIISNYLGIRNTLFYAILGIGGVWFAFLLSGVHPTIAGILGALTIPSKTRISAKLYINKIKELSDNFGSASIKDSSMLSAQQLEIIGQVKETSKDVEAPLQSIEHALHPWITYLVIPLFVLANAGIFLSTETIDVIIHPVSLGILFGLLIGKVLGIVLFAFISFKIGLAALPKDVKWIHIIGLGFLAGIGFTMSLFISNLAFVNPEFVLASKIGVFLGSIIAGTLGFIILRFSLATKP